MIVEDNLYQKLAKIRKRVSVIKKESRGFKYYYTKEEDILARVTGLMDRHGVSLIPSIKSGTIKVERETKDKEPRYLITADMLYTWVNNDHPEERIEVPWAMVATMQDAAQAFGSSLTYSSRYFLLKYFNIANSQDDPDYLMGKQQEAIMAEEAELNNEILNKIDKLVKQYLSDHPDKREEVVKITKRYVKGGNYFNITESALSNKLLKEIEKMVSAKGE